VEWLATLAYAIMLKKVPYNIIDVKGSTYCGICGAIEKEW